MTDETELKTEEAPKPTETWLEPSGIGGEYMRHESALLPAARVPVHKAFAIGPEYNVGMLRRMAEAYKPKKIVVIDHGENGIEVRRLGDNADVRLFYASLNPTKLSEAFETKDEARICLDAVRNVLSQYFALSDGELSKYDTKAVAAQSKGCISYAYLQRRLAPTAAFKNGLQGATDALKTTLEALEGEGLVRKLSKEETQELFESSAVFYRINRGALS